MREWSGGVLRTPRSAITGTDKRMNHLPVIEHSVSNPYRNSRGIGLRIGLKETKADMKPSSSLQDQDERIVEDVACVRHIQTSSRCVYNYEDRYRFSRVITDSDLIFDSHFESGNLLSATRIVFDDTKMTQKCFQEYDMEIHHDLNSNGYRQWFYFSCSNTCAGKEVKFNLTNFVKTDSLFNNGMRPLMFSTKRSKEGIGWKRVGKQISYYENDKTQGKKNLRTLSFIHEFEIDDDCCFFAFSYPYTYTFLQRRIYQMQKDPERCKCFRRKNLCKTLAGNDCDLLTITEPTNDWKSLHNRSTIIITARVHPGETNASWVCDGVIDFLTGPSPEAKRLRSLHVFKIVPMLNPDGVINGNYRTSMAGIDLNRTWDSPSSMRHPTIYWTKELVKRQKKIRKILVVCDFHGHSRKEGVFMYGCSKDGIAIYSNNEKVKSKTPEVNTLPKIMHGKSNFFKMEYCNFNTMNCKAPTMRIVMFKEFDIPYSYSMETSLGGIHGEHFNTKHLRDIGVHFCSSLLDFSVVTLKCNSELIEEEKSCVVCEDITFLGYENIGQTKNMLSIKGSQALDPTKFIKGKKHSDPCVIDFSAPNHRKSNRCHHIRSSSTSEIKTKQTKLVLECRGKKTPPTSKRRKKIQYSTKRNASSKRSNVLEKHLTGSLSESMSKSVLPHVRNSGIRIIKSSIR